MRGKAINPAGGPSESVSGLCSRLQWKEAARRGVEAATRQQVPSLSMFER